MLGLGSDSIYLRLERYPGQLVVGVGACAAGARCTIDEVNGLAHAVLIVIIFDRRTHTQTMPSISPMPFNHALVAFQGDMTGEVVQRPRCVALIAHHSAPFELPECDKCVCEPWRHAVPLPPLHCLGHLMRARAPMQGNVTLLGGQAGRVSLCFSWGGPNLLHFDALPPT